MYSEHLEHQNSEPAETRENCKKVRFNDEEIFYDAPAIIQVTTIEDHQSDEKEPDLIVSDPEPDTRKTDNGSSHIKSNDFVDIFLRKIRQVYHYLFNLVTNIRRN